MISSIQDWSNQVQRQFAVVMAEVSRLEELIGDGGVAATPRSSPVPRLAQAPASAPRVTAAPTAGARRKKRQMPKRAEFGGFTKPAPVAMAALDLLTAASAGMERNALVAAILKKVPTSHSASVGACLSKLKVDGKIRLSINDETKVRTYFLAAHRRLAAVHQPDGVRPPSCNALVIKALIAMPGLTPKEVNEAVSAERPDLSKHSIYTSLFELKKRGQLRSAGESGQTKYYVNMATGPATAVAS